MHKVNSIKAIVKIAFIVMCTQSLFTGCKMEEYSGQSIYSPEQMKLDQIEVPQREDFSEYWDKRPRQEVTLSAVGDIMVHSYQLKRAYNAREDRFDFTPSFAPMKSYLSRSDYTVGNLETTLAGKKAERHIGDKELDARETYVGGFSGYPTFNSPDVLIENLLDAGVDLVALANNHALDQGIEGLTRTIDVCDDKGMNHVGTYVNREDEIPYKRVRLKGMTFAFINYTYGTNGRMIDQLDTHIDSLHNYNKDYNTSLVRSIEAAKASPVDFVVVMMHYGFEYKSVPSHVQEEINAAIFDAGGDIILGGHPHTLQPIEVYKSWKGDDLYSPKLVIYSLGNFIASQRNVAQFKADTDIGVLLTLRFEREDLQAPRLIGFDLLPTYTYWQRDAIMTLPVNEESMDRSTYPLTAWDKERLRYAYETTPDFLVQYLQDSEVVMKTSVSDEGIHYYAIMD